MFVSFFSFAGVKAVAGGEKKTAEMNDLDLKKTKQMNDFLFIFSFYV